ncbi:MAG TPA: hypothetical protein ENJ19_07590 [Gammaproteobacteria bacterium]|nr:hypothetical protein [Gammaproteobacteria bacterium]
MNLRTFGVGTFAFVAFMSSAHALVVYNSDADSTFTLIDAAGMSVTAETGTEVPASSTSGTGTASVDADSQTPSGLFLMTAGDSLVQSSAVSGSADAPFGSSDATVLNSALITLDNSLGLTDATAVFTFSYSWLAELTKTDVLLEAGHASPFFHLTGFAPSGAETLAIDTGSGPTAVSDWLVNPAIALTLGGTATSDSSSGSATVTALVTVPSGSIDSFSVVTDSSGSALHQSIPEPDIALLLLAGAGAASVAARRGKKAVT